MPNSNPSGEILQ